MILTELKYIWAKAKRRKSDDSNHLYYHPLVCHMIDVAVVAKVMWNRVFTNFLKTNIADIFGLEKEKINKYILSYGPKLRSFPELFLFFPIFFPLFSFASYYTNGYPALYTLRNPLTSSGT